MAVDQETLLLIQSLQLDQVNESYLKSLLHRLDEGKSEGRATLYREGEEVSQETIYPTAVCPSSLLKELPVVTYDSLKEQKKHLESLASTSALWIRPMQAGTGSSIKRESYLKKRGRDHLGAKGTDLFITLKEGERELSLAEIQLQRAYKDAHRQTFGHIIFQDLVSSETESSLQALWNSPSFIDPSQSYRELFQESKNLTIMPPMRQAYLPTLLKESQKLTCERMAPGGHALFGMAALMAAYKESERPHLADKRPLIGVTSNGEDLSALPDPLMVGYMMEKKIPIVMVTTEKTSIDTKGGQLALLSPHRGGKAYVTIVEKAQAESMGELAYFEELGLREKDQMAFFNTNMALFNYDVLIPMLKHLAHELGEERLTQLMAPSLIQNKKEQGGKTFVQLEGAMGATLLNFDRFWRDHFGTPLVHFINVSKEDRTTFFSPIKTAFDFFMQFHSDRFVLDLETLRPINKRVGHCPLVELDGAYSDLDTLLEDFRGVSTLELDQLTVKGRFDFGGMALQGKVTLINNSGKKIDLKQKCPSSLLSTGSYSF